MNAQLVFEFSYVSSVSGRRAKLCVLLRVYDGEVIQKVDGGTICFEGQSEGRYPIIGL
jgi:hypothetical protein